ncbi:hypothetical protein ABDJ41_15155 [Pedobacter sp. ASV1-7]|uniref:hypothetical protein n=1 Tax=Pedobacter sp. ASV1-7 TaxID=3145237 RepID=UPI0032E9347F
MKFINSYTSRISALMLFMVVLFTGCDKKDELDRMYEGVKIVGVKLNSELFTPVYTGNEAKIVVPAGRDLSKVKVQILVANGEVLNFDNNQVMDVRKALSLSLKGSDGQNAEVILKIQSPPTLSTFIIEGLNVPASDVHFGSNTLIVQVPPSTDLTSLKVTMGFVNGTLVDFTNGVAGDYSSQKTFSIKGVDGETIYTYNFIITTEQVGPASIKSMTINGKETVSVETIAPATVVPFIKGLTNFTSATVTIEAGFGNVIDPAFTGTNLNLLTGTTKVKITGSDGIQREFTIGVPKLALTPVFSKKYEDFGFPANDLTGVAFSQNYIVVSNYSATAPTVVGPNYYDLSGSQVGVLNKTGVVIAHSLRKLASDEKGAMLVVPLGLSSTDQTIYKWDNVTAAPTPYITYSQASLGLNYAPRSAGINISGSLDGDAIITVGMAQKTEVFVWRVTGGVLNPIPVKYDFPYAGNGFYWGIEPMPIGTSGFVGAATGNSFSGIIGLNSTMTETVKTTGLSSSDCRIYKHHGRVYLGFVVYVSGKGAYFRLADITDNQAASVQNPIMDILMPSTAANGNLTMDVDITKINGKLHAVFACTNVGMQLFKLEE